MYVFMYVCMYEWYASMYVRRLCVYVMRTWVGYIMYVRYPFASAMVCILVMICKTVVSCMNVCVYVYVCMFVCYVR